MTEQAKRREGWSLWVVMAAAAITYTLLSYVDEWISLPLREGSSIIAGVLLDLIGYPITRDGTIISTVNFRFEVVPACSGSTALKVLLALGITWCGSHPGLTPLRRIIAVAAAAPLAVVINGLRVAALVAIGDSLLHPLEGAAHEAIGILCFMLAIACLYLLGESLARRRVDVAGVGRHGLRLGVVLLLVGILAAPTLLWCGTAWWSSPLDHFGWICAILGGGAVVWVWRRIGGPGSSRMGVLLLVVALGLILGGVLVEVFIFQALGLLGVLLAIAWWTGGWPRVRVCLPFLAAASVGLPLVGFLLTTRSGLEGPLMSMVLRTTLFFALFAIGVVVFLRASVTIRPEPQPLSLLMISILAAVVAIESALVTGRMVPEPLRIEISWLQGSWVGMPTETDPASINLLGRDHVETRAYQDAANRVVQMIITTTGGDRHRAHPPEYCMTGAGWLIDDQHQREVCMGGQMMPVSSLSLHRKDVKQTMMYWFTDGEQRVSSYSAMLVIDTYRRLVGHRSDWALLRIIGTQEDLVDFIREFRPVVLTASSDHETK